ncbi:hypothetical protein KAW08_01800 [bacterium]|nr:hypothetical protein [bacterium]
MGSSVFYKEFILKRHPENPIIKPRDFPGAGAVCNCGQTMTKSYILAPEELYEQCGRVPNVVFPCGAIADYDKDEIRLYYGAADTCIGLATGSLSGLINACLKGL